MDRNAKEGREMTNIITADRKMREVLQLAKTVAQSKATVLIQGESGTGKELVASLIHENSTRASRPFVAINCAAIPENLLESELFGYERGAFTGAVSSKAGKFEFANGGTILLDEISEMDIRLQAKLLRVIQEGEVDRIGGRKPIPVDVRIIATTNRNLSDCVKGGTFREDLFYRLNVVNLTLPPLRERLGDVGLVGTHFLEIYAAKNGKRISGLSEEARGLLESHHWQGNVRELENVMERAVLTAKSDLVTGADIHLVSRESGLGGATLAATSADSLSEIMLKSWLPGTTLDDIEKNVIIEALKYHAGNRTHTARALGISIRTLRNKLADYRRIGIHL
jgi:transcriptional regulator with PAS, ATPase and Fis domain